MQSYVMNNMETVINQWLNTHVNPTGSAVMVDKSLTIDGAAADAKTAGDWLYRDSFSKPINLKECPFLKKSGYFNRLNQHIRSQSQKYITVFIPYIYNAYQVSKIGDYYIFNYGVCTSDFTCLAGLDYFAPNDPGEAQYNTRTITKDQLKIELNENYYFFFTVWWERDYSAFNQSDIFFAVSNDTNDKHLTSIENIKKPYNIKIYLKDLFLYDLNNQYAELHQGYLLSGQFTQRHKYLTIILKKAWFQNNINYVTSNFQFQTSNYPFEYLTGTNFSDNLTADIQYFGQGTPAFLASNPEDITFISLAFSTSYIKHKEFKDYYFEVSLWTDQQSLPSLFTQKEEGQFEGEINPIFIDTTAHRNNQVVFRTLSQENVISKSFPVHGLKYVYLTNLPYISQTASVAGFFDEWRNFISQAIPSKQQWPYGSKLLKIPDNAYYLDIYFNYEYMRHLETQCKCYIVSQKHKEWDKYTNNPLYGKKMVWYGTSIPAGGYFGLQCQYSYPQRVGSLLGAYVSNEAVGSSGTSCRTHAAIAQNNPRGFGLNFEATSRCLGNSYDDCDWLINNYNKIQWTYGKPTTPLTDDQKNRIRRASYQNKIDYYLHKDLLPDVFVFDHGHNDTMDETDYKNISYYNNLYNKSLTGQTKQGWYQHNKKHDNGGSYILEFNVSSLSGIYTIIHTVEQWYDSYNLLDAQDAVITDHDTMVNMKKEYVDYVDLTKAAKLVIYNDTTNLCIAQGKIDYGMDVYTFKGRMNFFINRILEFNPRQRIVMIGEYSDQNPSNIWKAQKEIADEWNLPILNLSERLGWAKDKSVFTKAGWNNDKYWDLNAHEQKIQQPFKNFISPDALHPHTDASHKTNEMIATIIANWMKENVVCY